MKKSILILAVIMMNPFTSCDKEIIKEIPDLNFTDSKKAAELIEADTEFGLDLFKEVLEMPEVPDNVMISPLSVAMALGMTYNGGEGGTKSAFEETLRLKGFAREEINNIHKTLLLYLLSADPKVVLEIANSIWYREDYAVLKSFIDTNKNYYQAEVRDLDFNDPSAKDIINGWVADKTHDKILNIIDNIPDEAVMYLINAIYFNGMWTYRFDSKDTYKSAFTKEDQSTVEVSYMKLEEATMAYLKNDLFSAVELPYGNGRFSMCFMLPDSGKNIKDMLDQLSMGNFSSWMSGFTEKKVKIYIPRFKFGYKELLNDPLTDMGLGVAFTDQADFTGINPAGNILISRVIHQSFIDVNEKGTEAAAATVVEVGYTSVGPVIPVFRADRPFLFLIREKSSNAILFMGRVGVPEYEK